MTQKPQECTACALFKSTRIAPRGNRTPVMFVGDFPTLASPQGGAPFQDRSGAVLGMALQHLQQMYHKAERGADRWRAVYPFCTYAVQCTTNDKPLKAVYDTCQAHLNQSIAMIKPKVIVTFGADATRSIFKEKAKFDALRGTFIKYSIKAPVVSFLLFPTYSPKAILAQPGLFNELMRDLKKVFRYIESGDAKQDTISEETLREHYRFPHTVEDVRLLCQEIIDYASKPGDDPDRHLISVDTETSTLEPHDPEAKIIAISFAWAKLKACAIVLDHPQGWWTPSELKLVKEYVVRVLACAKPKSLHNDKFDRQMIVHRYGWPLTNVVWDTMGAEHLLEEDKKGIYGLKDLTRARLPEYAGYEDKVAGMRDQHGGLTRAQEGKRFRRAEMKYQDALKAHAVKLEQYDQAFATYSKKLEAWQQRRVAEKEIAKQEKRRMNRDTIGVKPKSVLRPRPPKEPEHLEPFDYTMIPIDRLELYAAVDADVTRQHVLHQNQRFHKEYMADVALRKSHKETLPTPVKTLVESHVIPTSKSLAQMEFTGFPVNMPYLEELDTKLAAIVEENEDWLFNSAGKRFVVGNPQEVTHILFSTGFYDAKEGEQITVPITDDTKRTNKGSISADAASLLYIASEYGYEFPKRVIALRKAQKARSPFLTNVREHARYDGRMHSSFHITGTGTGRLSSSNENLQNVPKTLAGFNIKDIFVAPPGYSLIDTDAKGAEVRIFAAYSGDTALIKAINDGLDAHSFFSSKVFGLDYDEIEFLRNARRESLTADQLVRLSYVSKKRTNCKRVVFGTLYGAMARKIAETAGISLQEAQEVIDLMFKMFPSIPAYIEATHREVQLYKAVATFVGRKRRFPISDLRMFQNRCFRQAVNFKIQSTSSEIVMWVMNQIIPIITEDLRGQFHATVHDSIVYSVPDEYVAQIPDLMYEYGTKRTQEQFPWMPVPFLWDVEAGRSYGSCERIDDYIAKLNHEETQHDTKSSCEEEEEVITDDEIIQEFAASS